MAQLTAATESDSSKVSVEDFATVQRLMLAHSAVVLDERRAYLVDARLRPVADRYRLSSVTELIHALRSDRHQLITDTVDALTSNETAFFLTSDLVDPLVEEIVPDLLARRPPGQPLRIWSAACSSGQEPYSVAILMADRYPRLVASGEIRILASDLSPTMVMRCMAGRFSPIEMNRGLSPEARSRHFDLQDRDWVVRPVLRSIVTSRTINLIQAWPGVPRCDLILARGVLGYFPDPIRQQVLDRFRRSALAPHGYLILGSDDPILPSRSGFEPLGRGHRSCYRPGGAS